MTKPAKCTAPRYDSLMALHPKSPTYDPNYRATKSLEQMVAEFPDNQFLADRLSEQRDALEQERRRIAVWRAWVGRLKVKAGTLIRAEHSAKRLSSVDARTS
jgi:hypothetical protein